TLPGKKGPLRDLSNPGIDRFSEFNNSSDEHARAGITSKAAFLLGEGGKHPDTGVSVDGIGKAKVGELFYAVLTSLSSSSSMANARDAAVSSVQSFLILQALDVPFLQPNNVWTEGDLCEVKNAFKAVELGTGDIDCDGTDDSVDDDDDGDLIPDN